MSPLVEPQQAHPIINPAHWPGPTQTRKIMATTTKPTFGANRQRWVAIALLALALGACSNIETKRRDWSDYTGPGAEYFTQQEVPFPHFYPDEAEPFNRAMDAFNQRFMLWFISPLSDGWHFITTKGIRNHLNTAHTNLAYPVRLVNNLAQGKFSAAGTETSRFLINTTIGILGLFDPAASWGIKAPLPEDTGLSLEAAGWTDPEYLVIPFVGPSNTRDAVGYVPDYLLNIATYLGFFVNPFFLFNEMSDEIAPYTNLVETSYDPYEILYMLSSIKRTADILRFSFKADPESKSDQTLQSVFLAPSNPDFIHQATTETVEIPSTGMQLPYTYWLQPKPAPIVFVIPGTGAHRLSNHAVGLAEYMWNAGYSAITISNSMNWEFIERALSIDLPGYLPTDAHDTHVAVSLVAEALEKEHPDKMTTTCLMGMSLGAMQVIYIAAEEQGTGKGLKAFDAYLSIASPVRLEYASEQIDNDYNAPLQWPAEERADRMNETLHMALALAGGSNITPSMPMPFSEIQASYLIGLDFRLTLMAVIFGTQYRHNLGVLLTKLDKWDRGPAYREISDYSFAEYIYGFMLPYLTKIRPEVTNAETFFYNDSLLPLESKLRKADRLRVFTNKDDPLQSDSDRDWQRNVFGDRVTILEHGGHLGNFHSPVIVKKFMKEVKDLIDTEAARKAPSP